MSGYLIIYVFVVLAAVAAAGFMAVRKGENQVVIRTSIILVISACYLMWAITYLAQLHPLIKPRRSDLKPSHVGPESDYLY
ncbi:ATP synthase subunit H-domain-containing protein [Leucosporidium creatinivorum]|uniref:ATP synthase subunit H-domain-containing protein n=1 Tax=Leucosporidium creatinivorum TaxID=106004 RepID=A0A1Y2EXC0_9BASI|nr:ATP synthase subunit H-domain-containing protein [Leucosporidium creatinivorum]